MVAARDADRYLARGVASGRDRARDDGRGEELLGEHGEVEAAVLEGGHDAAELGVALVARGGVRVEAELLGNSDGEARQPIAVADLAEEARSEEHTSELQSLRHLVCRLLLEKKN